MLCMYNYVDKSYDEIIPYTHNTTHVIILPLEIIIITSKQKILQIKRGDIGIA